MLVGVIPFPPLFPSSGTKAFYFINRPNCAKYMQHSVLRISMISFRKPDVKRKMKLKGMDPNFIRNMKFAKKHNLTSAQQTRQLAKKEKASA